VFAISLVTSMGELEGLDDLGLLRQTKVVPGRTCEATSAEVALSVLGV
jgi:hypothetical protein